MLTLYVPLDVKPDPLMQMVVLLPLIVARTTIAGLVLVALGRVPTKPGDRVELARWTIEVTGTAHHAITEVRLTPRGRERKESGIG